MLTIPHARSMAITREVWPLLGAVSGKGITRGTDTMTTHDPIAYTYEADYHCPACTEERFGRGADGFIATDSEDNEGNPVGAVFSWDEWQNTDTYEAETLSCSDCQGVIDSCDAILPDDYVDQAFDAYVECALWSSTWQAADEETGERGGDDLPMDEEFSSDNIDGESYASMRVDVEAFCESEANDLVGHWDAGQAGHDFWLTRNGHGAGFWDRGQGARGDKLADAARAYGTSDLYVGDDGNVYVI